MRQPQRHRPEHQLRIDLGGGFHVVGIGDPHDGRMFSRKTFGSLPVEQEFPARHARTAANLGIHAVHSLANDGRHRVRDAAAQDLVSFVNFVAAFALQHRLAVFFRREILSRHPVEFSRVQFAETLRKRGETADVVVAQNETGRFFRKQDRHVENVFPEPFVQRTVAGQLAFRVDHTHPGFDRTGFQVGRRKIPRAVAQHRLKQHAQARFAPLQFRLEFPIAFQHQMDFFHRGKPGRIDGQRIKHIAVAGPGGIFHRLACQLFFFSGRIRQNVEKHKIPVESLILHKQSDPFFDLKQNLNRACFSTI